MLRATLTINQEHSVPLAAGLFLNNRAGSKDITYSNSRTSDTASTTFGRSELGSCKLARLTTSTLDCVVESRVGLDCP